MAGTTRTTRIRTARYELQRELGRGGMAVVHAALDRQLDRRVALKVLAAHLAGDDEFRLRFLREARISASLHHPNIVRVYDISELDGLPCIVMELVDGGTLDGARITLDEAAQVADGLAYAHSRGVVHRDLKPGNLLRARDGLVKIADFGIARAATETQVTQVGTVLGTLAYLSPEQADGRVVGPPADVFTLGVVLDELLGPRRPSTVRVLLERCRARDPRRRPAAAEVAAVLRAPAVYVQRRRAPLVALAAALAAGLAITIGVLASGSHSSRPVPPPRVAPVGRSTDASQQAGYLVAWLRRYGR